MSQLTASITLNGPIDVLAKLLASLGGGVSVATINPGVALPPPAPAADDESGDVTAQPGQVDANGIPWDDRIHSTPAKLTTKNVWRAKRGVADALVAQVEAELRARAGQPAPMAAPMPMPPPAPVPVTMPPGYPPAMPMPMPPPAPVPVAPPAPVTPVAPAAAPTDFNSFMMSIQSLITANKVDAAYFGDLVGRVNAAAGTQFGAITDLATRPDLVGWVWSVMQSDGKTA